MSHVPLPFLVWYIRTYYHCPLLSSHLSLSLSLSSSLLTPSLIPPNILPGSVLAQHSLRLDLVLRIFFSIPFHLTFRLLQQILILISDTLEAISPAELRVYDILTGEVSYLTSNICTNLQQSKQPTLILLMWERRLEKTFTSAAAMCSFTDWRMLLVESFIWRF